MSEDRIAIIDEHMGKCMDMYRNYRNGLCSEGDFYKEIERLIKKADRRLQEQAQQEQ